MEVSERIWRDPHRYYIRLLPQSIGITPRCCSRALERVLSDFGFTRSFRESVLAVKEHYGFEIPETTLANVTRKHAQSIQDELSKRTHPNGVSGEGCAQLITEADGSFVRIVTVEGESPDRRKNRCVDYRETRLCAAQSQGAQKTYYEATFGKLEQVALNWLHACKNAGLGLNTQVHGVSDGAVWIEEQYRSIFKKSSTFLVDFYHVCEYLGAASHSCSKQPAQWLKTQRNRLKKGAYTKVIQSLKEHLEADFIAEPDAPVRRAHRYLLNRMHSLDYDLAIGNDLPIGSGLIESGHKHVIQARMKIAGASWSMPTAEAFVHARTLRANGYWDCYWNQKTAA